MVTQYALRSSPLSCKVYISVLSLLSRRTGTSLRLHPVHASAAKPVQLLEVRSLCRGQLSAIEQAEVRTGQPPALGGTPGTGAPRPGPGNRLKKS